MDKTKISGITHIDKKKTDASALKLKEISTENKDASAEFNLDSDGL